MEQVVGTAVSRTSFTTVLISAAAALAFLLGLVGIYGVVAYTVAQRNRETGIRIALGASPSSVSGMFLRQGIVLSVAGTLIGLLAAAGASRWMSSLLFGVTPLDARTYLWLPSSYWSRRWSQVTCRPTARHSRIPPKPCAESRGKENPRGDVPFPGFEILLPIKARADSTYCLRGADGVG
jgi:ABC-type antimicrobial peptide transport system permease subunit